jgi:PRC-barrel domain protein
MNPIRTLCIVTASTLLSTAALAQEPPAGATERAAGAEREIAGDTKPKDKLVGLPVESASGEQLGSVVDIVRNKAGTPEYAVVAIDTDTTAVPYETALAMVRNDKVVMSAKKLAAAPKVKQSEWLDEAHTAWRQDSDRYWGNTRTASKQQEKKPSDR